MTGQKGFAPLLILIAVLIVIGIVAGTYYFGYDRGFKETINSQSTSTPSPSLDPTTNWKIYTNSEYKFSVKYPPILPYGLREGLSRNTQQLSDPKKRILFELGFYPSLGFEITNEMTVEEATQRTKNDVSQGRRRMKIDSINQEYIPDYNWTVINWSGEVYGKDYLIEHNSNILIFRCRSLAVITSDGVTWRKIIGKFKITD